jgi:hypothetical protein
VGQWQLERTVVANGGGGKGNCASMNCQKEEKESK